MTFNHSGAASQSEELKQRNNFGSTVPDIQHIPFMYLSYLSESNSIFGIDQLGCLLTEVPRNSPSNAEFMFMTHTWTLIWPPSHSAAHWTNIVLQASWVVTVAQGGRWGQRSGHNHDVPKGHTSQDDWHGSSWIGGVHSEKGPGC